MEKKFTRTIGKLEYNQQHNFFHGNINGMHVTVNLVTLKDNTQAWLVKEEMMLFEHAPKATQGQNRGGGQPGFGG